MPIRKFDDFRWADTATLELGYGHVRSCTVQPTGGLGGSRPSIRTTGLGETVEIDGENVDLNFGVYEGFPSTSRSGVKTARGNFSVVDNVGWAFIEVWQGDKVCGVYVNGNDLQVYTMGDTWTLQFTAVGVLNPGTFKRIDLAWTVSSLNETNLVNPDGSIALYVDNVSVGSASGIKIGYPLPIDFVRDVHWNVVVTNPHGDVDMMVLMDDTTTILPDGLDIFTVFPTGSTGTFKELTTNTGTNHGALIDDAVDDGDATYVYTSGAARKDSWPFNDFASIGTKVVRALKQVASGKKTESGFISFRPFMYRNGTIKFATSLYPVGVGYFNWQDHVWLVDPYTTKVFTVADINNSEFGTLVG